jgi:hyperosmotically inducible protein
MDANVVLISPSKPLGVNMRRIQSIRAVLALFAVCTLAGTLHGSAKPPQTTKEQREARAEQNLAREIRHQLVLLPYYTVFDNLAYRLQGDQVILEGQVTRPTLKSDAENVVKSLEGVRSVTNNIEVLPPSPMDEQLRRELYRAIYGEPSLFKYSWSAVPSIHIIVKNGHVTLVGVVDNETDKNLAEVRAKGVANVFSVTNSLQVANSK